MMTDRPNIFFRLALATGVLFVVTVLALTATIFGDPRAPSARFLDNYGGALIAAEVAATLIFAFWAMALDRRRQVRGMSSGDGAHRTRQHHQQEKTDGKPHDPQDQSKDENF